MANEQPNIKPHLVTLKDRKEATLSGISEVLGFDEQYIGAVSDCGQLAIHGEKLKIVSFDAKNGNLSVAGDIMSLVYAVKRSKDGSFLSRLTR